MLKKINLKNKTALVTGAGKGLGKACSIALAEAGAKVIILSRTKSDLDKVSKIIKKTNHSYKFDIRFHMEPNVKLMQTQDNKTILIQLADEGWKFTCEKYDINIDNGLYFGNKNLYSENQNIFISGISGSQTESIKWEIKKI